MKPVFSTKILKPQPGKLTHLHIRAVKERCPKTDVNEFYSKSSGCNKDGMSRAVCVPERERFHIFVCSFVCPEFSRKPAIGYF
jgi:hypothetical protein